MITTFKKRHINIARLSEMKSKLREGGLHTVCESALCPNIEECFSKGTATFLIAGNICTRNCTFCAIENGKPMPLDTDEPKRVAKTVDKLGLKYTVITSVTRDDLPDGAAGHFTDTVQCIRKLTPDVKIEILVPDFMGNRASAKEVFSSKPYVFNHNLETVPRLYPNIRPKADYQRSLQLLEWAKESGLTTKSGLMLGIGETEDEVIKVMNELRKINCDILTLGQYLTPSKNHYPVKKFLGQEKFDRYRNIAIDMGFSYCASAPYVRSSYMAEKAAGDQGIRISEDQDIMET